MYVTCTTRRHTYENFGSAAGLLQEMSCRSTGSVLMPSLRRYWILLGAVCYVTLGLERVVAKAHHNKNEVQRVQSFTAALVSFDECASGTTSENGSILRCPHLQELIYGYWPWMKSEMKVGPCPEDFALTLLGGRVPSVSNCNGWSLATKYLVILAIRADNTTCQLQNELLLGKAHFVAEDLVSGRVFHDNSIITRASGAKKPRQPDFIIYDKINGIGQSELVVEGEFLDEITIEVSSGRDGDSVKVLLLPSLWSVYAWIGAIKQRGGKPIKNGFDVSKGKFYAVTKIYYSSGEVVSVTQSGSKFYRGILQVDTQIDGDLPSYDLSDPDSIKHDDYNIVFLKVNSTSLFGRAERWLTTKGRALSYIQETTLTVKRVDAVKQSAIVAVRHLERRRTLKDGKVHISMEAEIERVGRHDISTACCDHGLSRARKHVESCGASIDACSSKEQTCCGCCARGRIKAREGKDCSNSENDPVCRTLFTQCCTRDIKSTAVVPTHNPALQEEIRLLCCRIGSVLHLQGGQCRLLLPQFCGSVAEQCCECCRMGSRDARRTGQCRKEGSLPECRATRYQCCEKNLQELTASTQQPLQTLPRAGEPLETPLTYQKLGDILPTFKSTGSGNASGTISGHRVSHMRIRVGRNMSSDGESSLVCTFVKFPDSIPSHHLVLIMSISSWPFAWLLAVDSDRQRNPFLEITDFLEINGTVHFESKRDRPSKVLAVKYRARIMEKSIVEIDFTFDGEIPLTVNGSIELGEYHVRIGKSVTGDIRHATGVTTPVYDVTIIRSVLINGKPFSFVMQLEASARKWAEGMLPPNEQRVSIHERNVVVSKGKKKMHLFLTSHVSTSPQHLGRVAFDSDSSDASSASSQVSWSTQSTDRDTKPTESSHHPSVTSSGTMLLLLRLPDFPKQVIVARGTLTGIINDIEINEAPFAADLDIVSGSLQVTISTMIGDDATWILQLLPIGLPLYVAYVTNATKLSAVSLEAEVAIDSNHIVRLAYAVSSADDGGSSTIHVTAYGTLPADHKLSMKLKKYQLAVIRTSQEAAFIAATSKLLIGNRAATFTLQSKAMWKCNASGWVDAAALISSRSPQVEEELSSVKVLFKVTMSIVQRPDFTDGCCLFGLALASDSGRCRRRTAFPTVCNTNKAIRCCQCCFSGHQISLTNVTASHSCLEHDYDGTRSCQKTAKNCCLRSAVLP